MTQLVKETSLVLENLTQMIAESSRLNAWIAANYSGKQLTIFEGMNYEKLPDSKEEFPAVILHGYESLEFTELKRVEEIYPVITCELYDESTEPRTVGSVNVKSYKGSKRINEFAALVALAIANKEIFSEFYVASVTVTHVENLYPIFTGFLKVKIQVPQDYETPLGDS